MWSHPIYRRPAVWHAAIIGLVLVACTESPPPSGIDVSRAHVHADIADSPGDPNSAAGDVKAFIGAWLDGQAVQLRYTRSYYCEEPPSSIVPSECEIGALPESFPRGGPIPIIYAIAPIGFTPNSATLHCPGAPLCPNHPPMIDVTRLGLPASIVSRAPHSHIITSQQGGWHRTVNIRVTSPWAWDQIVAAPTLETVRQLQATHPEMISGDNPTNIFFFFEVHSETPAP